MSVAESLGSCACGCGAKVKPDHRRFAPGHNPHAPSMGPPSCRGCERVSRSHPGKLRDYEATTNTYTCRFCRDRANRVAITCRQCGASRSVQARQAAAIESLVTGPDGATYICLECFRPAAADMARAKLLAKHYGVKRSDPPEVKRAALADHAQRMVRRAGGREHVLERALAATTEGLSDRARRRRTIGLLVSKATRRREFRLCPLCGKLTVLTAHEVREGRPGFHGACARQWEQRDEYRRWRRQVGSPRSPLFAVRLRQYPYPLPSRPANRPPGPHELEQHFRWTLRRYGHRESWRDIAREESVTHGGARKGVLSFIALLPDSWRAVFGGAPPGPSLDEHLPIEQLRRAAGIGAE